jgi:hypothetical protein
MQSQLDGYHSFSVFARLCLETYKISFFHIFSKFIPLNPPSEVVVYKVWKATLCKSKQTLNKLSECKAHAIDCILRALYLECIAEYSGRSSYTFRQTVLPPSSESTSKISKKPAKSRTKQRLFFLKILKQLSSETTRVP